MFCTKCGIEIKEGYKFCPKCGTPVYVKKEEPKDEMKKEELEDAIIETKVDYDNDSTSTKEEKETKRDDASSDSHQEEVNSNPNIDGILNIVRF